MDSELDHGNCDLSKTGFRRSYLEPANTAKSLISSLSNTKCEGISILCICSTDLIMTAIDKIQKGYGWQLFNYLKNTYTTKQN